MLTYEERGGALKSPAASCAALTCNPHKRMLTYADVC
jgi:hypothetical protein